jgi:hypothetical protein
MPRLLTPEQDQFLKNHVVGKGNVELLELINRTFDLDLKLSQLRAYKKNHKLSSGLKGHFKKGHVPVNKGTHNGGWEPTQFKKGHRPHNYDPIGTEKEKADGYVWIKIADPHKWRQKHRIIWEEANGPIPKGHKVLFGDGDNRNFDLDNLILVTDRQMAVLNKKGLRQNNADLTRSSLIIADIYSKLRDRKRK